MLNVERIMAVGLGKDKETRKIDKYLANQILSLNAAKTYYFLYLCTYIDILWESKIRNYVFLPWVLSHELIVLTRRSLTLNFYRQNNLILLSDITFMKYLTRVFPLNFLDSARI